MKIGGYDPKKLYLVSFLERIDWIDNSLCID